MIRARFYPLSTLRSGWLSALSLAACATLCLGCGGELANDDSGDGGKGDETRSADASVGDPDAAPGPVDLILDEVGSPNPRIANVSGAVTGLPASATTAVLPPTTENALQGFGCFHTQSIQAFGNRHLVSLTGFTSGYVAVVEPGGVPKAVVLNSQFNHAGGFQMVGDLMVVAFENHCSMADEPDPRKVVFLYDMADPYNPVHLSDYDLVLEKNGSQAVGAVHLQDSLLIAVVTARDKLQFWRLDRGQTQWQNVGDWDASNAGWSVDADNAVNCTAATDWCWPQNVNLVQETSGDIYLLTFASAPAGERVGVYKLQVAGDGTVAPLKGSERFLSPAPGASFRSSAGSLTTAAGALRLFGFGGFFCGSAPCTAAIASW